MRGAISISISIWLIQSGLCMGLVRTTERSYKPSFFPLLKSVLRLRAPCCSVKAVDTAADQLAEQERGRLKGVAEENTAPQQGIEHGAQQRLAVATLAFAAARSAAIPLACAALTEHAGQR
jgi:hypothetical protein